jgi:hypothetical protein
MIAFLLSGYSIAEQDVFLLVDQDDIAANDKHLQGLATAFGHIWSNTATHDLRNVTCATTRSDIGDRVLEDLTAIPDLLAGALCEVTRRLTDQGIRPTKGLLLPPTKGLSWKSKILAEFLARKVGRLEKITCVVTSVENGAKFDIKIFDWSMPPELVLKPLRP